MTIVLGVDLGTTKITALAVETDCGAVLALAGAANQAETTAPDDRARGWCEWDARRIVATACGCLRRVAEQLGGQTRELIGLGITGQQHGVVVVDDALEPLTPFINWQDRRALPPFVQELVERAGADAPQRTGCRLAAGYMGVTLAWLKRERMLPEGLACFLMDYFAATLTGQRPVTDPTCAASSGLLDVRHSTWDALMIAALGLGSVSFPEVRPSGERLGTLIEDMAAATGLPAGLPVFIGIGDNQASFVGSVGDPAGAVLVNVGTGGQVAAFREQFHFDPVLETRPFPRGGYLLVSAGLSGGAAYATLERFFRQVVKQLAGVERESLYEAVNSLAADAMPGAGGVTCEPFFAGTRAHPEWRASWAGLSTENFTPGNLARSLLEGMARAFRSGFERMGGAADRLIGAGNGLRENPLLARIVAEAFALPLRFPHHREEAAFGAALVATVGAGVFPHLSAAGRLVRHEG